ncbi:hypothetical protein FRC09_003410 [Ceratobasidium sp. 395]|nr:hypothetical protein FRC09_003410 [Ceratobasidium sp. 395]
MPASDPLDQQAARAFEQDLRYYVMSGRAPQSKLDWFEALPKRIRRSRRLIDEALGPVEADAIRAREELAQRRAEKFTRHLQVVAAQSQPQDSSCLQSEAMADRQGKIQHTPPTNPALLDIEHNPWGEPSNPWAESLTDAHDSGHVSVTTAQRVEPRPVQMRDLSCLRGDAKPWMGIGRRKKRCRAFHAIGQAYLLRRKLDPLTVAAPVFTLEQEPEVPSRPDTPPDLREAVWRLDHSIYGLDGPSTPDIHSLASPEPESEPQPTLQRPLYPPTPPPIEQIPVQPGELNVYGHDVDPYFAYVVMRGRCAMAPQAAWSLRDAAVSIMTAEHIVPGVLTELASLLFPAGVHNFDSAVEPHEAVMDFCRGWFEVVQ